MAEYFPNQTRSVHNAITMQDYLQTQTRFGKALQSPIWHLLQGSGWANLDEHDGHLLDSSNHPWPDWEFTWALRVFQHAHWKIDQATEADSIPHARIHHQESGTIQQVQCPAKYTRLCQQKWNSVQVEWWLDKYPEGLIKEDMVLYPSLVAEIPGIVLEQDLPIPKLKTTSPRMLGHAMQTLSHSTLQEWMHHQSYVPTTMRLM